MFEAGFMGQIAMRSSLGAVPSDVTVWLINRVSGSTEKGTARWRVEIFTPDGQLSSTKFYDTTDVGQFTFRMTRGWTAKISPEMEVDRRVIEPWPAVITPEESVAGINIFYDPVVYEQLQEEEIEKSQRGARWEDEQGAAGLPGSSALPTVVAVGTIGLLGYLLFV